MPDKHLILSHVETEPEQFSREQIDVLDVGGQLIQTVEAAEDLCKVKCRLGKEVCHLALGSKTLDGENYIYANCSECPNPDLANAGVDTLRRYADNRLAALGSVTLKRIEPDEAVSDDIFEFVEDSVYGRFHAITVEGLKSLDPNRADGTYTRIMNTIYRSIRNKDRRSYPLLLESPVLQRALGSRLSYFLVAESLNTLLSDKSVLSTLGKFSQGIIRQAYQRAEVAGIVQVPPDA